MSFPKYEVYKDSGIEWVDLLPSHWSIVSLKWISDIFAGGTPDKKNLDFWTDGSIPWLNSGSVNQGLITEVSDLITADAYRCSSAKWIPKDALVIALAGQGKTKGMTAQLAIEATCNQSMAAIVLNDKASARYVYWWLTNNYQNIRNLAGGDLRDGLNLEMIGAIHTPIPTKLEQKQIANFLDRETTRIDTLIAEQQRLIELLKEKRQAVISHAVTKGIDRTVPMKDSGVEWLGEVPKHWEVVKLGHFAKVINGSTPDRTNVDFWEDGDIPWINSGALNEHKICSPSELITQKALAECSVELIPCDSVLVGLVGQGKTRGLSSLLTIDAAINQNVAAIVPAKDRLSSSFLHLFLQSIYEPLRDFGRGANQAALNCELVSALRIPLPPKDEQNLISAYLEHNLNALERLEHSALNSIGLMQERRSALISAAVTGKIDVRNWKPSPEPTPTYGRQ
jgi:type I restriction enzyme, S subunit